MCSCCDTTYYEDTEIHLSSRYPHHLGLKPLTGKRIKNPKLFPSNERALIKGHGPNYDDLLNLLKETDVFSIALERITLNEETSTRTQQKCLSLRYKILTV